MSGSKKKRLSMLDTLASAGAQPPAPMPSPAKTGSMLGQNGALRSARDAVDAHQVWDLDPWAVEDTRLADRLDPSDVVDLQDAIETNGQTVPILVRRDPKTPDRYMLVYGRRRLEAIRNSDKVTTVRALVAAMDDDEAVRAQISENMARRDLSFIEKALFARDLVDSGFGNQAQVAEVLTVTKSAISMALAIVDTITPDLARQIGPAPGIGRPRWETLAKAIETRPYLVDQLVREADRIATECQTAIALGQDLDADPSVMAFDAVLTLAQDTSTVKKAEPKKAKPKTSALTVDGVSVGKMTTTAKGVRLDIDNHEFAAWLEIHANDVLHDLHARFKSRIED